MKLYDSFFHELMLHNPSNNDCLQLSKYKHLKYKMENMLDESHIKIEKKIYKKYLELLKKKENLNIFDKTLKYICEDSLDFYKYNLLYIPINHHDNLITYILENANGNICYTYDKKSDYDDFLKKMEIFPEIINSIINNMKIGIEKKVVLPKVLTIELIKQLKSSITKKAYIVEDIKFKLSYDFNKKLDDIFIPHINKLIKFLKEIYLPKSRNTIGLYDTTNGINTYKYLVRSSLTLKNVNIDKMHNYGIKEVERIHLLMIEIKNRLNFKGTLKEFNKHLKNKKSLHFKNKQDVLKQYRNMIEDINNNVLKKYFKNKIKNKCIVESIPDYNEEFASEAYYIGGDLENTRKGKFFINLRDYKDLSKIEMESLTLHEVNPGHHFQITYHNESKLPLFIKVYNNDCYAEGWALYCEKLGDYTSLESYYGKLVLEMIRALRIVLDTGIHYYKWSYEKTFKYSKKYSFDSDKRIHNQLLRYIAIPTQALTYKMGEKFILDLLKKYDGNIKDFHDKFLEYGPIPLFLLKEVF